MKTILPFRASHYDAAKVTTLSDCVSPPYDVISDALRDALYAQGEHNFCRVDYAKGGDERYETAARTLQGWIDSGVVARDATPGIYFHWHDFTLPDGRAVTRKAFFALRKLESFGEGGVKPHEKTLDAPKADRLNLMKTTRAQLSPVFSLYSDPEDRVMRAVGDTFKTTPLFDFVAHDGARHRLWKVSEARVAGFIDDYLAAAPVFIADGHHRYETALNYRDELLAVQPDLPESHGARYALMLFANMDDPGLVILPIHRAVHGLSGFSVDEFLTRASAFFSVRETAGCDPEVLSRDLESLGRDHHAFALVSAGGTKSHLLFIDKALWLKTPLAQALPPELAALDVTVLHRALFQDVLGMTEEAQARQENLTYYKTTEDVLKAVGDGCEQAAFLLNATRINEMRAVAAAGLKMPQKSTFFYPKAPSGIVWHELV